MKHLTLLSLALCLLWASPAMAFGDKSRITIPMLSIQKTSNTTRNGALRRMLLEVEKRTSVKINASTKTVTLQDPKLFTYPMVFWTGDGKFNALSVKQIDRLRRYLKAGGLLVVDSTEGVSNGPFIKSVKRELQRIYPKNLPKIVPKNHVLYKSFYLIPTPYGRIATSKHMEAIFEKDRLSVILSTNDLLGAWAKDNFGKWLFDVSPGGDTQREMAFRLGVNLLMYALCINYKSDQVHIPFILKRRKWRVD